MKLRYKAHYFFLLAAVLVLVPISVRSQCTTWDAGGRWDIKQPNVESPIQLTLQQNGRVLTGKAKGTFVRRVPFRSDIDYNTGLVDGTIDGDSLSIQIYWSNSQMMGNGKVGVYNATVRPSGRLEGEAYEKSTPKVRYSWFSQGVLRCLPPPPPPVVSKPPKSTGKPKPVKSTGKPKPTTSPSTVSTPEPMKVPGIVANPVIYPNLYAAMGFTVLTWDAGPDHPYAEIWYKVNNGEETFLVEQGKGSRQVPVERGKLYTYILTDAGKTLATVIVIGN